MKLIDNLGFVKVEKPDKGDSKEEVIENLKRGFEEMKLHNERKTENDPCQRVLR